MPKVELIPMKNPNEAGVDEVGRGCLFGPVCSAAVILPDNILEIDGYKDINDSKSITPKMRRKIVDFIKTHALSYSVAFSSAKEIDDQNILCATISTMHKALDELHIIPSHILVDGTQFKKYKNLSLIHI